MFDTKKLALFLGGVVFGSAGFKVLSSKDAKKVYSHTTAAVLRAKDCVMQAVTNVREDAEDVYADAKDINERRAAEEGAEVIEDASEEKADEE
mgnify:CR=1 FL=1